MHRPPPISTRPDTLFPYPALFGSAAGRRIRPHRACDGELSGDGRTVRRPDTEADRPPCRARARCPEDPRPRRCSAVGRHAVRRSEEHTSELQSLMRISYAVFCLKKKKKESNTNT